MFSASSPLDKQMLPVSPPHPPMRSRDAGRVKDFPAGNIATSSSRIAFLKSLCNLPKYLDLVQLVQVVVGASSYQAYWL
jgi:hypothetical protein